jgi:hypothetical protein
VTEQVPPRGNARSHGPNYAKVSTTWLQTWFAGIHDWVCHISVFVLVESVAAVGAILFN